MAYDFVAASNQYLVVSSTPVTAAPMTIACWAIRDLTGNRGLVILGNSSNANARMGIWSSNGGLVQAFTFDTGNNGGTSSAGAATTGTLFHAAGVFASSASRTAYANGVAGNANTSNITPTGLNRIGIGARVRSSVDSYHDGLIAEVGIWNAALTAAEIASLAKGVTCNKVRPQSLVFYAPLIRDLQDVRGGLTITNTNSATVTSHPRVYK